MKASIAVTCVCLLPILSNAQLRTPENVPITFYGKAVDQNGNPVSGAKVGLLLVTSHMSEYTTSQEPMTLQTGEDGTFELTGVTGYAIDKISITKDGYELSKKAPSGEIFGMIRPYKPDAANPVIFRMWKMAGKEPLISSSWQGRISCDGRTNYFNLQIGKPGSDGALEIICTRTPLQLPSANVEPFDYHIEICILGGGILATRDEFTFLAPESGYSRSLSFGQRADDPNWDRHTPIPEEFYIRTAEGHYGRLSIKWYLAQKSPTHFEWDCTINPSGSRNLER